MPKLQETDSAPEPKFCGFCGAAKGKPHKGSCQRPRGRGGPMHGDVPKKRFQVVLNPADQKEIRRLFNDNLSQGIAALLAFYKENRKG